MIPRRGRASSGQLNQVNPAGTTTLFSTDWDDLIGFLIVDPLLRSRDSHFLINNSAVIPGDPHRQEGPNILQAIWAYPEPQGLSVPFAHLVIPDAAAASVFYRGIVLVGQSASGVEVDVSGLIVVPEPTSAVLIAGIAWVAGVFLPRRQRSFLGFLNDR